MTPTTTDLAHAKLASSGLTPDHAIALGIEILEPDQTAALFPMFRLPSLLLAYHHASGERRSDTCRARLLKDPPPGAFGQLPTKAQRYVQPAGTPPAAYFPRTRDWPAIIADPTRAILITEGELKAACAASHGINCIGLGGVSSYQSKRLGITFLPELEAVVWKSRDVVICYDSDAATNPAVALATARLARELRKRGALPRVLSLPALPDAPKTGLDDYIVARGPEAFFELIDQAPGDPLSMALHERNARYVVVRDVGLVHDLDHNVGHRIATFIQLQANDNLDIVEGASEGAPAIPPTPAAHGKPAIPGRPAIPASSGVIKQVNVTREWLRSAFRNDVQAYTHAPGEPQFTDGKLNMWQGWAVEPIDGPIDLFFELIDRLFIGAPKEHRDWFVNWYLYPLKHPGAKLSSACILWSDNQGVGKSTLGETAARIHGKHHASIGQEDLESGFNGWAVNKTSIMIDDMTCVDSRSKADTLKKLITQTEINVNTKYVAQYSVPDHANYLITSNQPNAIYLEEHDRRYFVHEITCEKDEPFFERYYAWSGTLSQKGPGPAHLLHYAQEIHDFGDFNPHRPPPITESKRVMQEDTRSDVDVFLHRLKNEPETILRNGQVPMFRDLYTTAELRALFDLSPEAETARNVSTSWFGRAVKSVFGSACSGILVIQPDGSRARMAIVRNADKWHKATADQIRDHLENATDREKSWRPDKQSDTPF